MDFGNNIPDGLRSFLQDILHNQNSVEKVEYDESLNRNTESSHRSQLMEIHAKISKKKAELAAAKETRLKWDENLRTTIEKEQKNSDKITKKLNKSIKANQDWKMERDNLQQVHLESLNSLDNIKRFIEYLGFGYGAEDSLLEGQTSFYLTKIHPTDPSRKYHIYFNNLRLKDGAFEVSTVSPEFSKFDEPTIKELKDKKCFNDLVAFCVDTWRKDIADNLQAP